MVSIYYGVNIGIALLSHLPMRLRSRASMVDGANNLNNTTMGVTMGGWTGEKHHALTAPSITII